MIDRVNERGKVFTERVKKVGVEVDIVTIYGYIRGHMHVLPTQRVRDLLNSGEERFLAVTGAAIMRNGDTKPQEASFIAINKEHIVLVIPVDETR